MTTKENQGVQELNDAFIGDDDVYKGSFSGKKVGTISFERVDNEEEETFFDKED